MEGNELNEMNSKFEYNEKSEGLVGAPRFLCKTSQSRSARQLP